MVRITEELVRKRAEHNEGEIFSLEELSLHQQDIEKIENLDKWCRELKILYLQSNLISKIENVGRLKKLEYLNLALNNIELIENLENCESLRKLDLTVNFVGNLSSIGNLRGLDQFQELYLTGNPCQSYDGYRPFVVACLPQLQTLDGTEITKSERIAALQLYPQLIGRIERQQEEWMATRDRQKADAAQRRARRTDKTQNDGAADGDDDDDGFWQEKTAFTPESRLETHEYLEQKRRKECREPEKARASERRLFAGDGRPYNINEAKIEFSFIDDEDDNCFQLDVEVYKYLDTSLLDCDIQPLYVRVFLKGKLLQLALPEEIQPDRATATRSKTTGHLLIKMPKVNEIVRPVKKKDQDNVGNTKENGSLPHRSAVGPVDWRNIVRYDNDTNEPIPREIQTCQKPKAKIISPPNSSDFVDDPSVPPLE